MTFVNFVKWLWDRNPIFLRVVGVYVIFCAIPCFIAAIWVGKSAILIALSGMVIILYGWLIHTTFYGFRNSWREYKNEQLRKEDAVICKLKGISAIK